MKYPILEFDSTKDAIIEPGRNKNINYPEYCVITFFKDIFEKYKLHGQATKIGESRWETGVSEFYNYEYKGKIILIAHGWVGAPIAAGVLEILIAHGVKKVIACGGCGILDEQIPMGNILLPESAIRDEGTSYHYIPASREIKLNEKVINNIEKLFVKEGIDYQKCKTWTTDAFFRETQKKLEMRKAEGCLTVEMECSALAAVSEFRGINFGQLLYSGDNVSINNYDEREWWKDISVREKLFLLSLDCCISI